jgi:hypothetical protein
MGLAIGATSAVFSIQEQAPALESIAAHAGAEGGYNYSGEGKRGDGRAFSQPAPLRGLRHAAGESALD